MAVITNFYSVVVNPTIPTLSILSTKSVKVNTTVAVVKNTTNTGIIVAPFATIRTMPLKTSKLSLATKEVQGGENLTREIVQYWG